MLGMISMPDNSASSQIFHVLTASKSFATTLDRFDQLENGSKTDTGTNTIVANFDPVYCRFSIEPSLAVNAISWSDNCAIASSFTFLRFLSD